MSYSVFGSIGKFLPDVIWAFIPAVSASLVKTIFPLCSTEKPDFAQKFTVNLFGNVRFFILRFCSLNSRNQKKRKKGVLF
jgi:hypothetical protein